MKQRTYFPLASTCFTQSISRFGVEDVKAHSHLVTWVAKASDATGATTTEVDPLPQNTSDNRDIFKIFSCCCFSIAPRLHESFSVSCDRALLLSQGHKTPSACTLSVRPLIWSFPWFLSVASSVCLRLHKKRLWNEALQKRGKCVRAAQYWKFAPIFSKIWFLMFLPLYCKCPLPNRIGLTFTMSLLHFNREWRCNRLRQR